LSLTEDQQRAVYAPGSVAVVAGAGTGKTHMLAERYVCHLDRDELSALQVVAVTFTERAAAELRSRIRRRLQGSEVTGQEALAELEAAQIGTIHALCARVCREHPEEAGVPPDFEVLDALGCQAWMLERMEEAMEELPQEHYLRLPYPELRSVLERLLADPVSAGRALSIAPEGWEQPVARAREEARKRFLLDPALDSVQRMLEACEGGAGDRIEEARTNALEALERLRTESDPGPYLEALCTIDLRGGSKKKWAEVELSQVKESLRGVRELAREERKRGLMTLELGEADGRLAELLPALREAFETVRQSVYEAKRDAGRLDFADLEVYALRALQDEEVRSYYAERWRAFLVDEFQDTNPIQAEIIDRLTGGATLTVVGDEQQAIYGFRRAEVRVFRRYRRQILEAGGSEVVLSESFRTHDALIRRTNAIFSRALGELHQPLTAHRLAEPHAPPHVEAYSIEPSTEGERKESKDRLQRAEATLISRLIGEALQDGLLVHDPDTNTTRSASPGDFAVLSRTWAPLEVYDEALAAAGIPAVHAGGGDLLEAREAKDGLALLRFMTDIADDLALVAVLRSPFYH
jgi:ATP-dependent helicase/nuclease subunit A